MGCVAYLVLMRFSSGFTLQVLIDLRPQLQAIHVHVHTLICFAIGKMFPMGFSHLCFVLLHVYKYQILNQLHAY